MHSPHLSIEEVCASTFLGKTRKSLDCSLRQDGGKRGNMDNIWIFDSALHGAVEWNSYMLRISTFPVSGPDVNCASSHKLSPFTPAHFTGTQICEPPSQVGVGHNIGKCDTYKLLKCFVLPMCFKLEIEMNAAQHTKALYVTIQIGLFFFSFFLWQVMYC